MKLWANVRPRRELFIYIYIIIYICNYLYIYILYNYIYIYVIIYICNYIYIMAVMGSICHRFNHSKSSDLIMTGIALGATADLFGHQFTLEVPENFTQSMWSMWFFIGLLHKFTEINECVFSHWVQFYKFIYFHVVFHRFTFCMGCSH